MLIKSPIREIATTLKEVEELMIPPDGVTLGEQILAGANFGRFAKNLPKLFPIKK